MRRLSQMALVFAMACGGKAPDAKILEQCDNQVDDDGDGDVDCDDSDCASSCDSGVTTSAGTPTTPTTTFTGTTGVTNPGSPITLTIDPTINLFQHQVGLTQCPQALGRVIVENTTDEQVQIIVSSERYEDQNVFHFNLENETQIEPWVDWPIDAQSTGVVWVYYACNAPASFIHFISVDVHTIPLPSSESNGALIQSQGTIQ